MYNQTDISISQFRVAKIAIQNCPLKCLNRQFAI